VRGSRLGLLVSTLLVWLLVGAAGAGATTLSAPVIGIAGTSDGHGYWLAGSDGGVFTFGDAGFHGSMGGKSLAAPVVGIARTPDGGGYWLAAADGGVFSFGDAGFHGSMAGKPLNKPVVGIAPAADGKGYWLAAADGGVFAFGDAGFYGSVAGKPLNKPVVGVAATPDGKGYWLVAADGGVFNFGDAGFYGSLGNVKLNAPIVGIAATPDGKGYWLVGADGGVFAFGDAGFHGSLAGKQLSRPVVGIAATPDGRGYWLTAQDGGVFSFGDATYENSLPGEGVSPAPVPHPPTGASPSVSTVRTAIVALAKSQIGYHDYGSYCTKYAPSLCEYWCSIFVTWVWGQNGIPIGILPFSGSVYGWSYDHTYVLPPSATPQPGDAVLFGTSPDSTSTSTHVGIVDQVFPSGDISVINGDFDHQVEEPPPFPPSQAASLSGAGEPIYAYASPVPAQGAAADLGSAAAAGGFPFPAPTLTGRALKRAIDSQDRRTRRAARLLRRAPAYAYLPLRTRTLTVTAVNTTRGGRIVLRAVYAGKRTTALRSLRRFLRRHHDSGRDYVVIYVHRHSHRR
jgi:hypothetical protein